MKVSRIEIFGFKSFMERLVLPLDTGVTGVVGPNGCGKSNIVDALRWVLGETRASSLRGGVLEDVIFNGTDRLRPLGLAEVTISLRATDADMFEDLVSGEAEADLVAAIDQIVEQADQASQDSNVTADGVDASNENGSSEAAEEPRLRVLQGGLSGEQSEAAEVAGDLGSNSIQDAAPEVAVSKPVAQSAASLASRFSWLKSVNEVQVTRRLYRSGESEYFINRVSCRLRDLKDFFRAVGLSARAYTIVAQGEVSRIVTAKPEERRQILEEAAGVVGFRDKIISAGRRLEESTANLARIEDIIKEVTRQVSSLRRQAGIAKNRQELKQRLQELDGVIARAKVAEIEARSLRAREQKKAISEQGGGGEAALERLKAEEHSLRSDLLAKDMRGDELRARIDGLREELSERSRKKSSKLARVSELAAFAAAQETESKRLLERQATLASREQENRSEVEGLVAQEQKLSQELGGVERISDQEVRAAATKVQEARERHRQSERELQRFREQLASARSRAEVLQQQLVAASPVAQIKKTLNGQDRELLSGLSDASALLIDSLVIPSELTKATQAVLGERAAFVVSADPHQLGATLVERAYNQGSPSKAGMAFGVLKREPRALTSSPSQPPVGGELLGRLCDLISVEAGAKQLLERLVGDVFVARNIAEARAAIAANDGTLSFRVVTLEGEILDECSFFSFRHEGGVVQTKSALDQANLKIAEISALLAQSESGLGALAEETKVAEGYYAELTLRVQQQQQRIREITGELGNIRGRLHSAKRLGEQLHSDQQKCNQQIEEAKTRIVAFQNEQAQIKQELADLQGEDDSVLKAEVERHQAELREIDAERSTGRANLARTSQQLEEVRDQIEANRAQISSLELELQKCTLERENIGSRLAEHYGELAVGMLSSTTGVLLSTDSEAYAEATQEVDRIRSRIQREGEVDPTAIERFEQENLRLIELESQHRDLTEATATIKETIKRLTATSEERFMSTFEQVREHFERLVPRLFGGGKGSLNLDNPERPLESGVEIMVRPPGKNLKSIDLLSGGEKALCATGLIMSMFLVRPSPLCVLDEVDAPLDEANLARFLSLIKDMSNKVQFLMITHNKNSMAVSDRLVGVTMQEPGASKVIGVSLEEAYSQVA